MKNHYILKTYCERIFLIGSGNFWYKENEIGDDRTLLYRAYSGLLFFIYGFMTVLEIMAATIGDYPEDEGRDAVTLALSHTIVMIKIYSVVSNKSFIKKLNEKMVTVCERYEEDALMAEKYKIMKINVIGYIVNVYGCCFFFIFEGIRKRFSGSHFVTVVTYYPQYEDDSMPATAVRILATLILYMMMLTMIYAADTFTMVYLIMYKYKFITLKKYFENLREEFFALIDRGEHDMATEKLANGLVEGIKMHNTLIGLSSDIYKAFGTVMALQVCQSSGSAVSLLLQIALSDQLTFIATVKLMSFVIALFFLLGLFLCNAGEITYQAAGVADAIFYCGWQSCPPRPKSDSRRNIRQLVVLAIMQAQRPLVMKAFKMLEMTYGTFILVVRSTYSVFALFYAQHK
uniref:Odorant receptor n=1 Tax=Athetis dissimilis TaxID=1737331 RepID=A0A0S1TKZ9_ATHDI|nr:odorant receptor 21 [Athetis dissimilis]